MVSLYGRDCSNPVVSTKIVSNNLEAIMGGFSPHCDPDDLVAIALYFEILFLEINNEFYRSMKDQDKMSMGLDDLVMSNHNTHENNLYLLKSRFSSTRIPKIGEENE